MEVKMNTFLVCTTREVQDGYVKDASKTLRIEGIVQSAYDLQQLMGRITKGGNHAYVIPCMDVSPITHIEITVNTVNITKNKGFENEFAD